MRTALIDQIILQLSYIFFSHVNNVIMILLFFLANFVCFYFILFILFYFPKLDALAT